MESLLVGVHLQYHTCNCGYTQDAIAGERQRNSIYIPLSYIDRPIPIACKAYIYRPTYMLCACCEAIYAVMKTYAWWYLDIFVCCQLKDAGCYWSWMYHGYHIASSVFVSSSFLSDVLHRALSIARSAKRLQADERRCNSVGCRITEQRRKLRAR